MKKCIKFLAGGLLALCVLLTSCDKEEKEFVMERPPIGSVYACSNVAIKFVSADSVAFYCKIPEGYNPSQWKGKAKYVFDKGKIEILDPYNGTLTVDERLEIELPFFYYFQGEFISLDYLEATMLLYGHKHTLNARGTWDFRLSNRPEDLCFD